MFSDILALYLVIKYFYFRSGLFLASYVLRSFLLVFYCFRKLAGHGAFNLLKGYFVKHVVSIDVELSLHELDWLFLV